MSCERSCIPQHNASRHYRSIFFLGDSIAGQMHNAYTCHHGENKHVQYQFLNYLTKFSNQWMEQYRNKHTWLMHIGAWYVPLTNGSAIFYQELMDFFAKTFEFCKTHHCIVLSVAAEHWIPDGIYTVDQANKCARKKSTVCRSNIHGLRAFESVAQKASLRSTWKWKPVLDMTATWKHPAYMEAKSRCDCTHFCYDSSQWRHFFQTLKML